MDYVVEYVNIKVKGVLEKAAVCTSLPWGSHPFFLTPPWVDPTQMDQLAQSHEDARSRVPRPSCRCRCVSVVIILLRRTPSDFVPDTVLGPYALYSSLQPCGRQVGWPRVYRWNSWGSERQSNLFKVTQLGSGRTNIPTWFVWFQSLSVQPTAHGLSITSLFWYLWAWLFSGA